MFYTDKQKCRVMNLEYQVSRLESRIEVLEHHIAEGNNFTGLLLKALKVKAVRVPDIKSTWTFKKETK